MAITLIIGGTRSGKSSYAEKLAAKLSENVAYLATAQALDEEMKERIKLHKLTRPANWKTYEVPININEVVQSVLDKHKVFLLDCLTFLISNILLKDLNIDNIETSIQYCKEKVVLEELKQLVTQIKKSSCHLIIVSNELGLGIVPANTLSRIYRDLVGRANQFLALEADQVILTWAGIPIQIKPTLERLE